MNYFVVFQLTKNTKTCLLPLIVDSWNERSCMSSAKSNWFVSQVDIRSV